MKLRLIVCCLLLSIGSIWAKDDARKASEALIKRVIPEREPLRSKWKCSRRKMEKIVLKLNRKVIRSYYAVTTGICGLRFIPLSEILLQRPYFLERR